MTMRTFMFNGFDIKSNIQADSVWMTIGLLLDRIVDEHMDEHKAVRPLKLMIELRDTLRLYYNNPQITVNTSRNDPESFTDQYDITMGYYIPSPLP